MITATKPIEQIEVGLSEDWSHVIAWGHTEDEDDTACVSLPLYPHAFGGDAEMAYTVTAGLLVALLEAFGGPVTGNA